MIRFVPDTQAGRPTPPIICRRSTSCGRAGGRRRTGPSGRKAADVSRDLFAKVTGPETGLSPDRSHFDGAPAMGWDGKPTPFGYDSWRTVSNWSRGL